jgi:hypothetical protein
MFHKFLENGEIGFRRRFLIYTPSLFRESFEKNIRKFSAEMGLNFTSVSFLE